MSWFLPAPDLQSGEQVLWHRPAQLTRSRGWVGGSLWVTNERVLFVPGRLVFPRQEVRQYQLGELESVGRENRDNTPYTGGMRTRIRLAFRDGTTMLLAVKGLDEAIAELEQLVPSAA
jgi:hypothetical protein